MTSPRYRPQPGPGAPGVETDVRGAPGDGASEQATYTVLTPDHRKEKLIEALMVLRQGRWVLLFTLLATVGVAAAYVLTTPAEYEAQSVLLIETGKSSGRLGVADELGLRERTFSNELALLQQSFPIAEATAERLLALHRGDPAAPLTAIYDEDGVVRDAQEVAFRLQRRYVKVGTVGKDVDMIRVVATSRIADEAALIANVFSEAYLARTQEVSRAQVMASREFLQKQEAKLQQELKLLEERLATYMRANQAVDLDEEARNTVVQIAQLEAMRDEARIEAEMQEASLRSLGERLGEIEPNLSRRLSSGVSGALEQVQDKIVQRGLDLEEIYRHNPAQRTNPSPEVARYVADVAALQAQARALSEQYVEEVLSVGGVDPEQGAGGLAYVGQLRQQAAETRVTLSGLTAKERALNRRLAEYQGKLRDIPGQSIELAQLQRARQAKEALYLLLVQKLQEARVAEESELGYAEVIRPAFVPTQPIRPRVPRSLLLSAFFGLALGVALVSLRKLFDTRLYSPEDLRKRGVHVIGAVESMEKLIRQSYGGRAEVEAYGRKVSTNLVMLLDPGSAHAEVWRQLRTSLQFNGGGRSLQSLLVTSPGPSDGKSTVAANLAVAMALAGKRTVLVDADLRRPRAHRMLGLPFGPGLVQAIADPYYFNPEVFGTGIPNLYLVPSGSTVPHPSEVLGSDRMGILLAVLREAFDVVILDTPPVLLFSDVRLLAHHCDGTVVVARAGMTDVRAIDSTLGLLEETGARVLGSVLNRAAPGAAGYGYGLGYRLGYGYRHAFLHEAGLLPPQAEAPPLRAGRAERGRLPAPSLPRWERPFPGHKQLQS